MKNLFITNIKLNNIISDIKKNNNCEILIVKKNFNDVLKNKTKQFSKIILFTEKILPRNSEIYKTISNFIKNEKCSFIEIGHNKSKVPKDKASSSALINGSGNNTMLIVEKIIEMPNV